MACWFFLAVADYGEILTLYLLDRHVVDTRMLASLVNYYSAVGRYFIKNISDVVYKFGKSCFINIVFYIQNTNPGCGIGAFEN